MEYMILITMLTWIAASAASALPGRERETGRLCALAAIFTAASGILALLGRGEAFADITAVIVQKWILAAGCIVLCIAAGFAFAYAWNIKQKKNAHTRKETIVEQSQQKK